MPPNGGCPCIYTGMIQYLLHILKSYGSETLESGLDSNNTLVRKFLKHKLYIPN
jgi:hypothetical protein